MRSFHIKQHSGMELKGDSPSIGRGSSHSLLQTGTLCELSAPSLQPLVAKTFSCKSKWHAMIKNLNQGLEFMGKQNSNLNEMERTLSRWRETPLNPKKTGDFSFAPETFLYLQTILSLAEENMFNHPLFGSGYETPIRIHLNLKGERFIQEVPVVPLLNQPGFQALAHSGSGSSRPSDVLFDSCGMEFLNSLLVLNKNIESMKRQLNLIEDCNPSSFLGVPTSEPNTEKTPTTSPRFSRFLNWANSLIKPLKTQTAFSS